MHTILILSMLAELTPIMLQVQGMITCMQIRQGKASNHMGDISTLEEMFDTYILLQD